MWCRNSDDDGHSPGVPCFLSKIWRSNAIRHASPNYSNLLIDPRLFSTRDHRKLFADKFVDASEKDAAADVKLDKIGRAGDQNSSHGGNKNKFFNFAKAIDYLVVKPTSNLVKDGTGIGATSRTLVKASNMDQQTAFSFSQVGRLFSFFCLSLALFD